MPGYKKIFQVIVLLAVLFFIHNLGLAENEPKKVDVFNGTDVAKVPETSQDTEASLGLVVSALRPRMEFSLTTKRDVFKNYVVEEEVWDETTGLPVTPGSGGPGPGPSGPGPGPGSPSGFSTEPSSTILEEVEPTVNFPELSVQGMIWDSSMPQAIINNKIFKVGDIIEGAKIVTIDQSGVSLVFRRKPFKVKSTAVPKIK